MNPSRFWSNTAPTLYMTSGATVAASDARYTARLLDPPGRTQLRQTA